MDHLDQLAWMGKEELQDQMETKEPQDLQDQTDHQETSEHQEPQECKDLEDHEDHQDKTETADPKDHQDHEETQDQLLSSTFQPDQNHWHQKDHRGDRLITNTNSTSTTPHITRRRMPRIKWICSISSMDSNLPCLDRRSLTEVPSIQQNRARKFKCACQKLILATTGWTPTEDHQMMPLQCIATSIE